MKGIDAILDLYFFPKRFERDGLIYKVLGVAIFKVVINATVGKFVLALRQRKDLTSYYISDVRSEKALRLTERWSRFNEATHIILTVVCLLIMKAFHVRGYHDGVIIMIFVVALNVYLIMLQRYNRIKILKWMAVLRKRNSGSKKSP
jgi:hypothetical protein